MAKKRKVKKSRVILLGIIFFLIICIIALLLWFVFSLFTNKTMTVQAYEPSVQTLNIDLNANNYLIAKDEDDHLDILYAKDEHEKIYPASLTKIMTMMVTLDYTDDIDEVLTVMEEDLAGLIEANASVYGLSVGDEISINDALYGLILESGADCANLLKRYVEEKGHDFVELMDQKAQALGMKDTDFANVTGLDDENNYTTVYDLGLLMIEAFKNDNARTILSTMHHTSDSGYSFDASMSALEGAGNDKAHVLGGKTGFTYIAHLTISAVVENDKGEIYFVILADADENGEDGRGAHLQDIADILASYFAKW